MITLAHQSCSIQLSPERGAIVTSLRVNDTQVLYLDQATFDDPTLNVRGGIPVLFPICGPQREQPGLAATMKQHGFARNLPWELIEQTSDRAALLLTDNVETRALYPHRFRYLLTYTAMPDGLLIEQSLTNTGEGAMPLQLGFHPYFLVGEKTELQFELPVSWYNDNKSTDSGTFQAFDFSREEIDWAFPRPGTQTASFRDPSRNVQITMNYSQLYKELVFWTLRGTPFICVEPWSSGRYAYPGPEVDTISPGEALTARVEILVEKLSSINA